MSNRRKREIRSARIAGFLSGLGIRPRRVRTPIERMNAALEAINDPAYTKES